MTKDDKTPKSDASATEQKTNPELNISKGKVKKNKKKKKHSNKSASSVSSSSASDVGSTAPTVVEEPAKEQFYDAHESYHGLKREEAPAGAPVKIPSAVPEIAPPATAAGPAIPTVATTLLVAHSEHGQDLKIQPSPPSAGTVQPTANAKKASSITKPVTGPQ